MAKEQAERRATAQLMFELGQKAYGKGMYGRAIEFLEGALTIIPRPTLLGGEVGLNNLIPTTDLFFWVLRCLMITLLITERCVRLRFFFVFLHFTDSDMACYGL